MPLVNASFLDTIVAFHLLTAILGVGPLAAMAILSSRRAARSESAATHRELLTVTSRWVSAGLGLMLLSGVLIGAAAGTREDQRLWYRASVLLLFLTGVINGILRRKLSASDPDRAIAFAMRASWLMCALVATITLLMTLRPN